MDMRLPLLALLLAAPAFADGSIPGDPAALADVAATGPLSFQTQYRLASEHSCSQSFESSEHAAKLTLTVAANGSAKLTVDALETTVFGPSLGRYREGAHNFQRTARESHVEWTGVARRSAGALTVELSAVRSGSEKPYPSSLRLACGVTLVHVQPASDRPLLPTESRALVCTPSEPLVSPIGDLTVGDALPFGRGAGFEAVAERRDFQYDHSVKIHRVR
jgi:hypothetical protein